ncbi:MAG: hypothetical protein KF789_09240 [Bdellovibrionaceae bacterium]|nr:hypothetical protein [Pseudobdellovibrionaceae bacterium]
MTTIAQNLFLGLAVLAGTIPARAETLSFQTVWEQITTTSPAQEAAALKAQSAEVGLSNAKKHWLPRVYLEARSARTNESGAVLFGFLGQRKVGAADFSPDSLNHPEAQTQTRGALGLDLVLYEGGSKQAQVRMYQQVAEAEKLSVKQMQIEQYGQAGFAYGMMASLKKQKLKLLDLGEQVSKLVKGYQLGQKSNPVGYSGLLGMKSLAIRIAGLVEQIEAQENASLRALIEMGAKEAGWTPESFDARAFTNRYFPVSQINPEEASPKSMAQLSGAKALVETSKMAKAHSLPRAGLFAESSVFDGSRGTANAYTAGLYLQWSLFDPSSTGKYKEAKLNALATEKMAQALLQQENTERQGLLEMERSLRSSLQKLDESEGLLAEQTQVSSTLFKNGSIGALQFVELLNRRTDLIAQQTEAEASLLKTSSSLAAKSKFEIPEAAQSGGRK